MPKGVFARRPHEHHGQTASITYSSWKSARERCGNPALPNFYLYGGRGVTMHEAWRNSYLAFVSAVGERPSPQHSLDRYPNPDGNYEPGNVRWATAREQQRNKRIACKLTLAQVEEIRTLRGTLTQKQIAANYGVSRSAISGIHIGRLYPCESDKHTEYECER